MSDDCNPVSELKENEMNEQPQFTRETQRATSMEVTELGRRIRAALKNVEPGSELERVLQRWKGYEHLFRRNGKWLIGGLITFFEHFYDIMRAVDSSLDPRLPPQCFDPESIAILFRIPREEFESTDGLACPTNQIVCPVGQSGRKNTTADIADFAFVRRQKEMSWKEILHQWRQVYPKDKRVKNHETIRDAYRRAYRGKGRSRW
jgi:hypothetical protein